MIVEVDNFLSGQYLPHNTDVTICGSAYSDEQACKVLRHFHLNARIDVHTNFCDRQINQQHKNYMSPQMYFFSPNPELCLDTFLICLSV